MSQSESSSSGESPAEQAGLVLPTDPIGLASDVSFKGQSLQTEVAALVAGEAVPSFETLEEFGAATKKLRETMREMRNHARTLADAGVAFVTRNQGKLTTTHLALILDSIRESADCAEEVYKKLDTQQKPASLATIIETMLGLRLFIQGAATGTYNITLGDKQFIVSGSNIPAKPSRKNEADYERFIAWVEELKPELLYADVDFTGLKKLLSERVEQIGPDRWKKGERPWPEWMRVYVSHGITIKRRS